MKTQFRKLRLLIHLGIIDPEDFYCITVYPGYIALQGQYNSDIIKKYGKFGTGVIDVNGYIKISPYGFEFTFTD